MAKDTRIIVRVPGEFNEHLAEYMFLLQDKGVKMSKAETIIQLAQYGFGVMIKELRESVEHDER